MEYLMKDPLTWGGTLLGGKLYASYFDDNEETLKQCVDRILKENNLEQIELVLVRVRRCGLSVGVGVGVGVENN